MHAVWSEECPEGGGGQELGMGARTPEPRGPVARRQCLGEIPCDVNADDDEPEEKPPMQVCPYRENEDEGPEASVPALAVPIAFQKRHDQGHAQQREEVGPCEPVYRSDDGGKHGGDIRQERIDAFAKQQSGDEPVDSADEDAAAGRHERESPGPVGEGGQRLAQPFVADEGISCLVNEKMS